MTMEHLRTRLNPFTTRRSRMSIDTSSREPRADMLAGLPPELLLSIFESLPPIDLICFSLCNHRILNLFCGKKQQLCYPKTPETLKTLKFDILIRLERDLRDYFLCDCCTILHRYELSESFRLTGIIHDRIPSTPCAEKRDQWWEEGIILRTHKTSARRGNCITFLHVKLAMRRFYHGPEFGLKTDSLSYTQVHQWPLNSAAPSKIALFSIDAQILTQPLGLHIRMQDILFIKTIADLIDWPDSDKFDPPSILEVCGHITIHSLIKPTLDALSDKSMSLEYNCNICNTDALIEIGKIDNWVTLTVTRWVNLGRGLSKLDPLWQSHTELNIPETRLDPGNPDHFCTTSPRLCFENMAPQSFKDIQCRNFSYLEDQRYKKVMTFPRSSFFWFIRYEEPEPFKIRLRLFLQDRSLSRLWRGSSKSKQRYKYPGHSGDGSFKFAEVPLFLPVPVFIGGVYSFL